MKWGILIEHSGNIILVGILVYYRIHKKFKKEQIKSILGFLDQNIVECIIGANVAPDTIGSAIKLINGG